MAEEPGLPYYLLIAGVGIDDILDLMEGLLTLSWI